MQCRSLTGGKALLSVCGNFSYENEKKDHESTTITASECNNTLTFLAYIMANRFGVIRYTLTTLLLVKAVVKLLNQGNAGWTG